jgi:L-glyceraldehyde 3-phosphate reductase
MIKNDPNPQYLAANDRYKNMSYRRCGKSGLKLPALSLGLWQNFGAVDSHQNAKNMLHRAFDLGINHFDLANNYGPPFGSAESTFGQVMTKSFKPYRDEMLISNKAGYDMWAGPYGIGGSRKYLIASCDQSLQRTGLDYFDVFYSHCYDPETPLEETMQALDYIVRSGRALYAGISSYSPVHTKQAIRILEDLGTPLLIHQPSYNMFDRWIEDGLTDIFTTSTGVSNQQVS